MCAAAAHVSRKSLPLSLLQALWLLAALGGKGCTLSVESGSSSPGVSICGKDEAEPHELSRPEPNMPEPIESPAAAAA
jgi:hypothetical protein